MGDLYRVDIKKNVDLSKILPFQSTVKIFFKDITFKNRCLNFLEVVPRRDRFWLLYEYKKSLFGKPSVPVRFESVGDPQRFYDLNENNAPYLDLLMDDSGIFLSFETEEQLELFHDSIAKEIHLFMKDLVQEYNDLKNSVNPSDLISAASEDILQIDISRDYVPGTQFYYLRDNDIFLIDRKKDIIGKLQGNVNELQFDWNLNSEWKSFIFDSDESIRTLPLIITQEGLRLTIHDFLTVLKNTVNQDVS